MRPDKRLREDLRAIHERDPAAEGVLTVLLCYPGMWALWTHRLAHPLWERGLRLPARLLAVFARLLTGVEIHPAAEIGRRVTIDHGHGVVIGETSEVGDDAHLYHGVTLGARRDASGKRHPTVESGVTLGARATLIGDIVVGEEATVGAGAVVVDPVPPETTVAGVPAEPIDGGSTEGGSDDEDVESCTADTCLV